MSDDSPNPIECEFSIIIRSVGKSFVEKFLTVLPAIDHVGEEISHCDRFVSFDFLKR